MAELFDMKELEERVILVAVSTSDEDDTEASLDELEELADTGTYLGSGKIGELREMVWEMGATGVICDDELSPAQLRNLESALDTKVMDRTMVILDIFAAHATTSEGKIQVELAQLRYRAARLVGLRSSLWIKAGERTGDPADRYGRIHPQIAAPSDRGVQEYAGGGTL